MVSTLKEAQKLQKEIEAHRKRGGEPGYRVNIVREVRYYADVANTRYALHHDWTIEQLEQKLWVRDQKKKTGGKKCRK